MSAEEWRAIPGFPGYEVSSAGAVRSFRGGRTTPRILSLFTRDTGYVTVGLLNADVRQVTRPVHCLVALAFHGERPEGHHVRHLDGDKANNRAANLRYGTPRENNLDTVRHGHHREATKKACKWGHLFTEENTRIERKSNGGTQRRCRTCARLRWSKAAA